MTDFLAWLFDRASQVYYWFDDLYNQAVQVVLNAWSWVISYYQMAILTAQSLFNDLYYWAQDFVNAARSELYGYIYQVQAWVSDLWQSAVATAQGLVNAARNDLTNLINAVRSDASTFVAWLRSDVLGWVAALRGDALGWIDSVRVDIAAVLGLAKETDASVKSLPLAQLRDLGQRMYSTLVLFVQDPAKFILGVITTPIFDWVAGVLADWLE